MVNVAKCLRLTTVGLVGTIMVGGSIGFGCYLDGQNQDTAEAIRKLTNKVDALAKQPTNSQDAKVARLEEENRNHERERINLSNQVTEARMEALKLREANEEMKVELLSATIKNDILEKYFAESIVALHKALVDTEGAKRQHAAMTTICERMPLGENYQACMFALRQNTNLLSDINKFITIHRDKKVTKPNQ